MLCQTCNQREALERDGRPARLSLFGSIEGYFCAECALKHQEPFNAEFLKAVAERAPYLTIEDLEAVPDQMLKFTLNLPIPSWQSPHGNPLEQER
jgi:protein-arginine kinase activator protein McsA